MSFARSLSTTALVSSAVLAVVLYLFYSLTSVSRYLYTALGFGGMAVVLAVGFLVWLLYWRQQQS